VPSVIYYPYVERRLTPICVSYVTSQGTVKHFIPRKRGVAPAMGVGDSAGNRSSDGGDADLVDADEASAGVNLYAVAERLAVRRPAALVPPIPYALAPAGRLGRQDSNLCISKSDLLKFGGGCCPTCATAAFCGWPAVLRISEKALLTQSAERTRHLVAVAEF
jgi:hypothetical protein